MDKGFRFRLSGVNPGTVLGIQLLACAWKLVVAAEMLCVYPSFCYQRLGFSRAAQCPPSRVVKLGSQVRTRELRFSSSFVREGSIVIPSIVIPSVYSVTTKPF